MVPIVCGTIGSTRSVTPSATSADTQSIVSAKPGALSSSTVRIRPTNSVVSRINGSPAPGTARRTIAAARAGAGNSIQW